MSTTRYAQPALFAVECAMVAALRSAGITPSAVIGHSVGELAAACAAGVMGLEEVTSRDPPTDCSTFHSFKGSGRHPGIFLSKI